MRDSTATWCGHLLGFKSMETNQQKMGKNEWFFELVFLYFFQSKDRILERDCKCDKFQRNPQSAVDLVMDSFLSLFLSFCMDRVEVLISVSLYTIHAYYTH